MSGKKLKLTLRRCDSQDIAVVSSHGFTQHLSRVMRIHL